MNCEVVFHRLPIRPGKPLLGAFGPRGQTVFGLPGNPVSSLVTARRFAIPVLSLRAGQVRRENPPITQLENDDGHKLALWWFRLLRRSGDGRAQLVETHGSGDLVSLARSDGFIEVPPSQSSSGPRPYFAWRS